MLKTNFFLFSTAFYFISLVILFLASFETYYAHDSPEKYMAVNLVLITFLLLTLFFAASNFLFTLLYKKLQKHLAHHPTQSACKQQLKEVHERISSIIDIFQEGLLIVDIDGKILMSNKAVEKLLVLKSISKEGFIFDHININNEKAIDVCLDLVRKSFDSGCVMRDSVRLGDQKSVYLDIIASPIDSPPRVVLIIQDNSNEYKISQLGKDFVANASHELRTPVTIIKGFAETLRDLPTVSESMLEDMTEKIIRSCHRMNNLVKNLLMLADLDNSSKPNFKACDLVSLFESVSYSLLALHPDVCIETLQNEEHVMIEADPDLLEQAIMNLFENAVKYSKSHAHITVTIKKEASKVTLQIEDRGIGISEDHLSHIFDRFYRVNKDRSRKLGGTGLGLSIVHSIIEKHHGQIQVYSIVDYGTTFTMTFPACKDEFTAQDTYHSHKSLK